REIEIEIVEIGPIANWYAGEEQQNGDVKRMAAKAKGCEGRVQLDEIVFGSVIWKSVARFSDGVPLHSYRSGDLACLLGHLPVLQHCAHLYFAYQRGWINAVTGDQLPCIEWLHSRGKPGSFTSYFDKAAEMGRMRILEFLHTHRPTDQCSLFAMNM
ncbi:unnamed protein product, partial [Heterosigma akashiwo]